MENENICFKWLNVHLHEMWWFKAPRVEPSKLQFPMGHLKPSWLTSDFNTWFGFGFLERFGPSNRVLLRSDLPSQ